MSNKDMKCGLFLHYCTELSSAIQNATNSGYISLTQFYCSETCHVGHFKGPYFMPNIKRYNFIVTNLVHPRSGEFTPHCDLQLSSSDWGTLVVGIISKVDLTNDCIEAATKIDAEITYAMHLGLPALLFESPSSQEALTHLARIVNDKITYSGGFQNLPHFWIQIPIHATEDMAANWRSDVDAENLELEDTWLRWNHLRSLVAPDKRVSIALELNGDLPDERLLNRWAGEPVKAVIIPTSMFLTNRKNYPVLSKAHQIFIRLLINKMSRDLHFVIKGHCRHGDMRFYIQYLEHIKSTQLPLDPVAGFAKGYEDYLQIPLQPLMDNLESCTYEVFEKDPVKYAEYGKAIYEALNAIISDTEIVIMVVGAGRGPLVHASLLAAEKCEKKVHIYAVEKNPNAVITLNTLREERWGGKKGSTFAKVEVIACDMREWVAPQKADLVVSELLGSFGDNELSPECLDGVWSYVKENCISIPMSYTSYLAPVQSQRLFCEASVLREKDKPAFAPFETGYVVHMRNCYSIDEPQPLFTFVHNDLHKSPKERNNHRHRVLTFHTPIDVVCHGFAGYFETTLYGDIKLSTVPSFHTPGMFSWFPIYFPIHSPIFLKSGQNLKVHFWRLINKRQIWYEWCITQPVASSIHNPNGRTYSIGLL